MTEEPIRVLQVFGIMNRGGAESFIMNLYRNIDRTKVQFDFIVHKQMKGHFDDEIIKMGGRIYYIPMLTLKNPIKYFRDWILFFRNHREYKIIHAHLRSTASIFLYLAKKFGLTTIAHSHNTSSGKGIQAMIKKVLQRPLRHIAEHFYTCSTESGRWLFGDELSNSGRVRQINNAISTKDYLFNRDSRNEIRTELGVNDKIVIGHVGRFEYQKNHDFLIDVFNELIKKNDQYILLLIGQGILESKVKSKVKEAGLEKHVKFLGVRDNVNKLLNAMDLFVFPSHHEGLPVTLIEAQANGVKCFVSENISKEVAITDLLYFKSISDGAESWAETLSRHSLPYDRTNRTNGIMNAGYDVDKVAKDLSAFYINIINDK